MPWLVEIKGIIPVHELRNLCSLVGYKHQHHHRLMSVTSTSLNKHETLDIRDPCSTGWMVASLQQ